MKNKFSFVIIIIGLVIAIAGLFFVLNYTNPETAGPFGILLTFMVIFAFSFAVIFAIINFGQVIYLHFKPMKTIEAAANKPKVFRKRTIYVSVALAFAPLLLLSLNSIGQLQLRDIFLIILIEVLAIFYIVKRI